MQINEEREKTLQKRKLIDQLKQQTAQAQYDKLELMRDFSTYEIDMADSLQLKQKFSILQSVLHKAKQIVLEKEKTK